MKTTIPVRTALLSAFDRTGLGDFALALNRLGWNILASAGTAKYLVEHGVRGLTDVASIVGPPILGHRVVTLSRELHAALLATDSDEDQAELRRLGVPRIDLVYCNFYPLENAIAASDSTRERVIEQTDIGGPTMLRSAAKGGRMVVSDYHQFPLVLRWANGYFAQNPGLELQVRSALVSIAERRVAEYCACSSVYHARQATDDLVRAIERGDYTF